MKIFTLHLNPKIQYVSYWPHFLSLHCTLQILIFLHTDLWAMGFIHCPYIQGEKSWFIAYSMDWESEFSRRYMIILKHRMIILHRTEVKPETDLFLLFIKSIFQKWQNTLLTYYINTLQVWNNWKSLEDIQNSNG